MTTLLKGKDVSDSVLKRLKNEVADLKKKTGKTPGLAVILVGDDPASHVYVGRKKAACEQIGMVSYEHRLAATSSEDDLIKLITGLNNDVTVNGILLQLPLPRGLDSDKLLALISPDKDVDGFHPMNVGKLLQGLETFKSCTPAGVMEILRYYKIDPAGKHVVIVGRSNIVGKPLAAMLVQKADGANATVTIAHSRSQNLGDLTRQADIVVAAIGRAEFLTADMIREGAVVIDVGINRVDAPDTEKGFKLVGDVAFDEVSDKASAITPVPGGVGPMTIAMLMANTLHAFKVANKITH